MMKKMMKIRRRRNKQVKILVMASVCFLFVMSVGYAAFQTNLNITVKGNIKDIKNEVDSKVPTDSLLFWGQADNSDNTLNVFKNKVGSNDGVMNGFDNTSSSGFNDGDLVFDGINDYVSIGLANYDFNNSISYVVYLKINENKTGSWQKIITNQLSSGKGGIVLDVGSKNQFQIYGGNGTNWCGSAVNLEEVNLNEYYVLVGTHNENKTILYINGTIITSNESSCLWKNTPNDMFIGASTEYGVDNPAAFASMSLKEVMVYDRALTEDEVKSITNGFEKKHQKQ